MADSAEVERVITAHERSGRRFEAAGIGSFVLDGGLANRSFSCMASLIPPARRNGPGVDDVLPGKHFLQEDQAPAVAGCIAEHARAAGGAGT